jgi:hypothetical protein
MLIKDNVPYRVYLPKWVFDTTDKEQFKKNLTRYMRWYPNYVVRRIEGREAICVKQD